jgi:hypothetical protein
MTPLYHTFAKSAMGRQRNQGFQALSERQDMQEYRGRLRNKNGFSWLVAFASFLHLDGPIAKS